MGQVPQWTTPPQPSGAEPHDAPSCAQVFGAHALASPPPPLLPPSIPPSNGAASTPVSGFGFTGGEASAPVSPPHERAIDDSAATTAPVRRGGAKRPDFIARITGLYAA